MKLYVGNLSFETTENDLRELFAQHGTVTDVAILNDRETGRSRGFGFVTFTDATGANAAIAALNGKEVPGRALTVNEARAREERPRQFAAETAANRPFLILQAGARFGRRFCFLPKPMAVDPRKAIEIEGKVMAVLAGTMFRVQLANDHVVLAHISGKMRKRFIRLTTGDRVKLQMSPYDVDKARIVYRLAERAWMNRSASRAARIRARRGSGSSWRCLPFGISQDSVNPQFPHLIACCCGDTLALSPRRNALSRAHLGSPSTTAPSDKPFPGLIL